MEELVLEATKQALAETSLALAEEKANRIYINGPVNYWKKKIVS